ncbi:MAG: prepilin peptidase [Acidobacteria bacterium]|nr:prepilin peptidase [Acidobacteriota bacterium]
MLIVLTTLFGLAVGSFLNVVIYRVPRHESVVSPRSACPVCAAPIRGFDNVPVLSWLLLRGRCRHCRSPISWRYPLVEATCAGLFAGAVARFGFTWVLPAYLVTLAGLLALGAIDLTQLVLPKVIVYYTLAIAGGLFLLATLMNHKWHQLLVAALYALLWFSVFYVMNLLNPRLLGFGDVRLAPLLGLSLGWLGVSYVALGFFVANLVGAVLGIVLIATKRIRRDQPIPYGTFLALGTAIALFAGPQLLSPFHGL